MGVANQYGIDVGNILSTTSMLKTAKLNQETKQIALEKDKSLERLTKTKLNKNRNVLNVKDEAEEELKTEPTSMPKSKNVLNTKVEPATQVDEKGTKNVFGDTKLPIMSDQEINDYAKNPQEYDKLVAKTELAKLNQRQYQQKLATLQMTMPGATTEQRQQLAQASIEDLKTFSTMIVNANEVQRKKVEAHIDSQAQQLFSITQLPKEGTARKDAYTQWRNNQIMQVPKDKQKDVMNKIPEWQDGVTANWIGEKIASSKDMLNAMNEIEAKKQAHLNTMPKTVTFGDKDILYTPKKEGGFSKKVKTSNALLKQDAVNRGKSGSGGSGAKTSQYQKDFTSREKQINSIMSGANIMNSEDKDLAVSNAGDQLISALKAFKRGDPNGYFIQFGNEDPLSKVAIRTKELKKKSFPYPDGFYELKSSSQDAWKKTYATTGKKLPLSKKDGGFLGDDEYKLKNKNSNKKTDYSNVFR